MKHIFLNLKRFDIPKACGGVNTLAPVKDWAETIISGTDAALQGEAFAGADYVMFFPEAHLLSAAAARDGRSRIQLGCQGLHREDTAAGGNFGAFTTLLTGNAARELGCGWALIGHCEERREKAGVLQEAGVTDPQAVNRLLRREVLAAQRAGLRVLYCIGESAEELPDKERVLGSQLSVGLDGAALENVVIGYEPIWSIGPGKTPAGREAIQETARFIKAQTGGVDVVYGGGLKNDNAAMLASIPEIDGGLIALTRFSGEIGFYPGEYLGIIRRYLGIEG